MNGLRRSVAPIVLVAVSAFAAACGSSAPSVVEAPTSQRAAADLFLAGYVQTDGRVDRLDQGGDTVSEGQAYAMLLDVATRDRAQFAKVWQWSEANLEDADGLLAYHWVDGKVADPNAASDADLDIAHALVLAGAQWHNSQWSAQGRAYAASILDNETVEVGGRLWLVAGPWARSSPYYLDPSYFDPVTFALLGSVTHDPRWGELQTSSAAAIATDTANGTMLPSDWATVSSSGTVRASAPPQGGPITYGYDAFRTLLREADACGPGETVILDARLLALAGRTASSGDRADVYHLDGTPAEAGDNPLMLIAAAGAAKAAGDNRAVGRDLDQAAALESNHQSYYFDAWVALGRYLLTTSALTGCTP